MILLTHNFQAIAKVYDCFLFYNELEILEIRLNELDPVVDYFVILESATSFRGLRKPYNFEENKERFAKFLDKIIYVKVDDPCPNAKNAWEREYASREALGQGLVGANPRDVAILSDCDEIPRAELVTKCANIISRSPSRYFNFHTSVHWGYLNRRFKRVPWIFSVGMTTVAALRDSPPGAVMRWRDRFRHAKGERIAGGGWHFTDQGGPDRLCDKRNNYSHWNDGQPFYNDEKAWENIRIGAEATTYLDPISDRYPKYVRDNVEYFKKLGMIWVD